MLGVDLDGLGVGGTQLFEVALEDLRSLLCQQIPGHGLLDLGKIGDARLPALLSGLPVVFAIRVEVQTYEVQAGYGDLALDSAADEAQLRPTAGLDEPALDFGGVDQVEASDLLRHQDLAKDPLFQHL
ncbi:uncharacterized protein METZ01_LOCUS323800, partial [marine metagenome]